MVGRRKRPIIRTQVTRLTMLRSQAVSMIANCDRYIEPQPPPQHRGVPQDSATGAADAPVAGDEMTLSWRSNFGWSQLGQGGLALWETKSSCWVWQFEQINSYKGIGWPVKNALTHSGCDFWQSALGVWNARIRCGNVHPIISRTEALNHANSRPMPSVWPISD